MNEIEIFRNSEFGEIRTTVIDGEPWFVGKDVAAALGYANTNDALVKHVDSEDKKVGSQNATPSVTDSLGREQYPVFINESGFYSLVLSSKLPTARQFKRWVTHEVIPTIRKTGSYSIGVPRTFAEALRLAADQQEQIEKQQRLISEQKPKVEFFDTVAESKTAVSMNDAAKSLNFNNVGRNKLFDILRTQKVLMSDNMPYQKYVDAGYFRVIEQKWTGKDGMPQISYKTLVYQKGIDYIRKLLEKEGYVRKEMPYEVQSYPSC